MESEASLAVTPGADRPIYIGVSGNIGRGVFASRSFQAGDLIEVAPVIVLSDGEWAAIEKTVLFSYCYDFSDNGAPRMALALGFGSMYNHSYTPNACYVKKLGESMIEYYALQKIERGEEITINYNGDPKCMDALWFPVFKAS